MCIGVEFQDRVGTHIYKHTFVENSSTCNNSLIFAGKCIISRSRRVYCVALLLILLVFTLPVQFAVKYECRFGFHVHKVAVVVVVVVL